MGLLVIAAWLQPESSGMGTHRQLGLPPCTFLVLFGIPCPSCGMTTSWSHFMRGEFGQARSANAGGVCLAALAAIGSMWSLLAAIRGDSYPALPRHFLIALVCIVSAVTVVDWIARMF